MAELEFKPKQSVKALLQNSILYYFLLRSDINQNKYDHYKWRGKYIPMTVARLGRGRQRKKQETGVKFISYFFTLQTTTQSYWGEGKREERIFKIEFTLPLSIYIPTNLPFLMLPHPTVQQSIRNWLWIPS